MERGMCVTKPQFLTLEIRRSVGEQLNHGVVGLVKFCKRFVIIKGIECIWIDVCVVGGRLVNVIGCVIVGTASSDGGNECGGLGTDGNKAVNTYQYFPPENDPCPQGSWFCTSDHVAPKVFMNGGLLEDGFIYVESLVFLWNRFGSKSGPHGGGEKENAVYNLSFSLVIEGVFLVEAARRFDASSSLAMYLAKATIDSLRRGWFDVGWWIQATFESSQAVNTYHYFIPENDPCPQGSWFCTSDHVGPKVVSVRFEEKQTWVADIDEHDEVSR
ncbi:hypothetical protein Tco_0848259 [Tanacetum coccineum]